MKEKLKEYKSVFDENYGYVNTLELDEISNEDAVFLLKETAISFSDEGVNSYSKGTRPFTIIQADLIQRYSRNDGYYIKIIGPTTAVIPSSYLIKFKWYATLFDKTDLIIKYR